MQFYWTADPDVRDASRILNIPDYAYSGHVEEAWGRYLNEKLKGEGFGFVTPVNAISYRCLLPSRYRELKCDEIFFYNGLRAVVHHARDENIQEWERSKEYAVRELT